MRRCTAMICFSIFHSCAPLRLRLLQVFQFFLCFLILQVLPLYFGSLTVLTPTGFQRSNFQVLILSICTGLYNPKILLKHSDGLVVWSHYVTKYYFQARVFSTLVKWINLSLNIVTRIKTLLSSGRPKLTKIGFP